MAGEKDFDDSTGKLKGVSSEGDSNSADDSAAATKTTDHTTASSEAKGSSSAIPLLLTSEWTSHLLHWLTGTTSSSSLPGTVVVKGRPPAYTIGNIEQKTLHRSPPVALITSSLQQEASRKLGFSPQQTMVSKLVSHYIYITPT